MAGLNRSEKAERTKGWGRRSEVRAQGSEFGGQRSDFAISRFQISALAVASPLWAEDFTARLFCSVEFWLKGEFWA